MKDEAQSGASVPSATTQDSGLSTQHSGAGAGTHDSVFITTNFMSLHPDVNPRDMAGDLTLMAWDSYPCPGQEKSSADPCFRIGDPAQVGFMHDYMASFCRRWGLMELQPGQVNWGGVPVHLHPGAVRLWLWTAFAHGAEFTTTYRFRQPHVGIEMFHHGLVGPDGHTPSLGGREFQQVLDEIARLDLAHLPPLAQDAAALPPGKTVGLVFDFEQLWWFKILPQGRRWDYARLVRLWYGALARLGLTVRVLRPDEPYPADLPLVVAPGLQMVDDAAVKHMADYARAGGHLVLTCRTALMDRAGRLFDGPLANPILPLIGGNIDAYDGLPEDSYGQVDLDGKRFTWGVWGDLLYSEPDTRILAKYADQFYEGAAAVIQNKVDKGVVTYCGVFGEEAFTDALAEKLAAQAKLAVQPLPPRVQLRRRGPYRLLLNYNPTTVEAPAPPRTRFLVGQRKVEPAGVAVWKEA